MLFNCIGYVMPNGWVSVTDELSEYIGLKVC
jgi:hypothetical protein